MLASFLFLFGLFLLHIPCWLHFYLGRFSYTSRAGFLFFFFSGLLHLTHPVLVSFFIWVVSLIYPTLASHLSGSFSYTSHAGFLFMLGVSLTPPMLPSFLCGEYLLHIPCCLDFYAGSFSYTSSAGFFLFLTGEFLLHVPCCFVFVLFLVFSGFFLLFIREVSLTHPVLASFLSGVFLLHILC